MWYVIIDGIRLPTPYATYEAAKKAMDDMRPNYQGYCMDVDYISEFK